MESGVSPGWMMRAVMPSVQAEAETRSAFDFTSWDDQSPGRELVLDQAVGGGGIGHPQQRLGQHHEGEPLLGGQRIGVQEILDPAEPAGPARGCPSISRVARRIDASLGLGRAGRFRQAASPQSPRRRAHRGR